MVDLFNQLKVLKAKLRFLKKKFYFQIVALRSVWQKKDADVENGLMGTEGEGEGETNWESNIDIYIYIYTLPAVK